MGACHSALVGVGGQRVAGGDGIKKRDMRGEDAKKKGEERFF